MKFRFEFPATGHDFDHVRTLTRAFGGFNGVTIKLKGRRRAEINGGNNCPEDILAALYLFAEGRML